MRAQPVQPSGNFDLVRVAFQDAFIKRGGPIGPLHGLVDQRQLDQCAKLVRVQFQCLLQAGLGARQIAGLVP